MDICQENVLSLIKEILVIEVDNVDVVVEVVDSEEAEVVDSEEEEEVVEGIIIKKEQNKYQFQSSITQLKRNIKNFLKV